MSGIWRDSSGLCHNYKQTDFSTAWNDLGWWEILVAWGGKALQPHDSLGTYTDVRSCLPVFSCTSTRNRRMAHTCLQPRLRFFYFFKSAVSFRTHQRESKALHDAALVTHSPCLVLITCACCNQIQTIANISYVIHVPGVRRVEAPYLLAQTYYIAISKGVQELPFAVWESQVGVARGWSGYVWSCTTAATRKQMR